MSDSGNKVGIGAYIALLFAVIFFSRIMVSNFVAEKTKPSTELQFKIDSKLELTTLEKIQKVNWVGVMSVMDFNTLNGKFGNVLTSATLGADNNIKTKSSNFSGVGGAGARQGFMFALTLIPTVMFALGMVAVLEYFGALQAMRQILSLVLRPIMGIPG